MSSLRTNLALAGRGIKNYVTKRPFCVSFEITYSCNAKCKHCHLGGPVDEERAAPEKYAEIARELNPVVAQISGGEPMLRRDLTDIIRMIKNPNGTPYIVLTTNAALLSTEKYYELKEAGVDGFSISLDFPDERHDDFRGVPGLYNKIQSLMEDIREEKNKGIALSGVVNSQNFRDLVPMAQRALEWGVYMNYSTYTWLRTDKMEYMISKTDMPAFKEVIANLLAFKKRHKNIYTSDYTFKNMIAFFENQEVPNCRAGEKFLVVNPDGSLSPCGLIIKKYSSQKEIKKEFLETNTCTACFTSIRANSEKPVKYLILDSIRSV
ncbi:MAG: radical SAM protein [Candidatus Aminicenantes bacterium]|nr:radical SAM protein [Candidatus Aminicenantes bacterium]